MIDCDVTLGSRSTDTEWPHDTPRVEITSGGPGSTAQNCCGFTASVNIPGGELHMESEDWSKSKGKVGHSTGQTYLDKGPSISGGQDLFNKTVHIRWMYQTDSQNNTYYTAAAWLKGQQPVSRTVTNISSPGLNGKKLILGKFAPGAKIANDPSRVRVDSAGLQIDFHGGPTVTILGKNTYKSTNYYHHKLGYISDGYHQSDLGYISNSRAYYGYEGYIIYYDDDLGWAEPTKKPKTK
jgi:hypothetical protein